MLIGVLLLFLTSSVSGVEFTLISSRYCSNGVGFVSILTSSVNYPSFSCSYNWEILSSTPFPSSGDTTISAML
jgi:hypothetical protein